MTVEEGTRKRISNFYREEFLRHKIRLEYQRPFFAENTYEEIESILDRVISEIDKICEVENFESFASHLLQLFDVVTNLSVSKVDPAYRVH
jgi:hypothetical protein